ncbi:MAG TPA: PilN domain-containing protein [Xanthomonadaceae bacterium]
MAIILILLASMRVSGREQAVRAEMSRLDRIIGSNARRISTPRARPSEGAVSQSNEQVRLLNRDWVALSGLLVPEAKGVRLLAIDVNPSNGMIKLSGAATSASAANDYVASLEAKRALDEVRLQELRRQPDGVRFEASVKWTE